MFFLWREKVNDSEQMYRVSFFSWLADKVTCEQLSELEDLLKEIESVCLNSKLLVKPLFKTFNLKTIKMVKYAIESSWELNSNIDEHGFEKSVSAISYYYRYLNEIEDCVSNSCKKGESITIINLNDKANQQIENENTQYKDLLIKYYPKGYRIESRLELNRFRRFWYEKYQMELTDSDEELRNLIARITIRYQDFVYLPEMMLSLEKETLLIAYINRCFANGVQTLYYKALFKEFEQVFQEEQINNSYMLKVFLTYRNPQNFHHCNTYFTIDNNTVVDTVDEIREFFSSHSKVFKNEEVYNALTHIPQSKIYQVLATHSEFINNARGQYFHVNSLTISKEEIDIIAELIKLEIRSKHFISGNELIEMIEKKHPEILHHNAHFSHLGLRDAIGFHLSDQFSFKGNIISELGQNLSMADVFKSFCLTRTNFTVYELNDLKKALNTVVYFDVVYENSLRISEIEFVSKECAKFDVEKIDIAIDGYCCGEFIPLAEITHFGTFPFAVFPWNRYLLEHYVAEYSIKYKLLHTGFNSTTCVGVIIKRSSEIDDYSDLLAHVLAKANIALRKDEALQYFYEKGYIGKRRLTDIEHIIIKANGLRQEE